MSLNNNDDDDDDLGFKKGSFKYLELNQRNFDSLKHFKRESN